MENKKIKICFAASSGGHFEQIMMLKPLMEKYNSFIINQYIDHYQYNNKEAFNTKSL